MWRICDRVFSCQTGLNRLNYRNRNIIDFRELFKIEFFG